jgi:DNA recombination protein RmuC
MENILYILIGTVAGAIITWLTIKNVSTKKFQDLKNEADIKYNLLDKELATYKASITQELSNLQEKKGELLKQIEELNKSIKEKITTETSLIADKATLKSDLDAANQTINEKNEEIKSIRNELKLITDSFNDDKTKLATALAENNSFKEKLETQKQEIEKLNEKFNTEFENIANKILETKTEKFTKLNNDNLKTILDPLGKNIDEFKKQVDEVYKIESKERFSLGNEVKKLAELNQTISEEARNLTKALKGEAKTQGRWGEMMLESILEKSGLVKGREYFMEHELLDENGNPLKSDSEGKKMRPDAVIKYPDNRSVIIDSKVSLNAFTRLIASNDIEEQKKELSDHVAAVKAHIVSLSTKGYDDYDKALDFVMMFIPSEPAYMAALQGDPDLWNFAYDKRILLINPTNLITSLKLIVDLWKREYQNQNALDIARRGSLLYDKFVGFVDNLNKVGVKLDEASKVFKSAKDQLSEGSGNLIQQATELKNLGLKTKKELPKDFNKTSDQAD